MIGAIIAKRKTRSGIEKSKEKSKVILVRDYIFGHKVLKRAWEKEKKLRLQMKGSKHCLTRCKRLRFVQIRLREFLLHRER